jgi:hypothetical protein
MSSANESIMTTIEHILKLNNAIIENKKAYIECFEKGLIDKNKLDELLNNLKSMFENNKILYEQQIVLLNSHIASFGDYTPVSTYTEDESI